VIYLGVTGDGRFAKIGFSRNPENRKQQLESGLPEVFSHFEWREGSARLEKFIHDDLAEFRARNEWFHMNNKVKFAFTRTPEPILSYGEPSYPKNDKELIQMIKWNGMTASTSTSCSLHDFLEFSNNRKSLITDSQKIGIASHIIQKTIKPFIINKIGKA